MNVFEAGSSRQRCAAVQGTDEPCRRAVVAVSLWMPAEVWTGGRVRFYFVICAEAGGEVRS